MPMDLYGVLKLVEQEVEEMRRRQQHVIAAYQQQTREELARRLAEAGEHILAAAEAKVNELNAVEHGEPYIIATERHVLYISRRLSDERVSVSIDPIVYPTPFNLRLIIDEPCVALHSVSSSTGILSLNKRTMIRGVDRIEQVDGSAIDGIVRVWLRDYDDESAARRIIRGIASLRSIDRLVEYMLTSGSHTRRSTIYRCEEHDSEPMHEHDTMVSGSSVRDIIRHHLKC
ncbi:MAG: hypothetical protein RMJ59_06630 [Candidatus Nitrosocaldus sp.]|nr:hypothetical protein [Candidatus Nitrosocaldus sp.]MDW8276035.1 hypothetical protein [Candidatus Nitrosocaldus sp.]